MARRSTSMLLGGSALLLMTSTASSASSSGLTMRVYNNSAWYGQPIQSSVVDGFDQQVPVHPGGSAFSVELVGTLTYPQAKPCFENDKGCYTFNCSFGAASYGFLWFDDHLVCQAGAYVLHPDSFDGSAGNPLRVLSKQAVVVRLQAYFDPDAAAMDVLDSRRAAIEANALELRRVESGAPSVCNSSWHEGDDFDGHDYHAQKTQTCAECGALCESDPNCAAVVWNAPGGMWGDKNCNMKFAAPSKPWKTNQKGEMGLVLRQPTEQASRTEAASAPSPRVSGPERAVDVRLGLGRPDHAAGLQPNRLVTACAEHCPRGDDACGPAAEPHERLGHMGQLSARLGADARGGEDHSRPVPVLDWQVHHLDEAV